MTIRNGDLVVVARACCEGSTKALGKIFVAEEVHLFGPVSCLSCKRPSPGRVFETFNGYFAEWRLKKIPPFPELEDEKYDEEVHA